MTSRIPLWLLCLIAGDAWAGSYAIVSVPPDGANSCTAQDVDEDLVVVGGCEVTTGGVTETRPAVWTMLDRVEIVGAASETNGAIVAIGPTGDMFGWVQSGGVYSYVRWTKPGTAAPVTYWTSSGLAPFPVVTQACGGLAAGTSFNGFATKPIAIVDDAVLWPPGPSSPYTGAVFGCNDDGLLVGMGTNTVPLPTTPPSQTTATAALVWEPVAGVYNQDPWPLDPLVTSGSGGLVAHTGVARDVNADGLVVGMVGTSPNNFAATWDVADGSLALLPWGAGTGVIARAVNDDGVIVGIGQTSGVAQAWIRDVSGASSPLLERLAPGHGWTALTSVSRITEGGAILGTGTFAGRTRPFVAVPIDTQLRQQPATPGLAGTTNTFTVSGVTPGATVRVYFGGSTGLTSVAGCPNKSVKIASAQVVGTAVASASGEAVVSSNAPSSWAGTVHRVQSVELGTCRLSNLVPSALE